MVFRRIRVLKDIFIDGITGGRGSVTGCQNYMHFTRREVHHIMHRIELDITEQCNLQCTACARSCGSAPSTKKMTVEQVEKFVNDSIHLRWQWESIMLIGGEPTLHPQLSEIIACIKKYKGYNNLCRVGLMTNGTGAAEKILPTVPPWITIFNNHESKLQKDQSHDVPFNTAPVDAGEWDEHDLVKCKKPVTCGMGLTRDGYFACQNAGGIHRVFNLGNGIQDLRDVTFQALDRLIPVSCKYCGFYLMAKGCHKKYDIHVMTGSWEKAFKKYNAAKEL